MDYSGNGTTVKYNPYTWSKLANVLWIESPRSVGFSRPNNNWTYPTIIGDDQTSKDTISVLLQWFAEFPQIGRHVTIAAESYGGHYSSSLVRHIQLYNAGVTPDKQITIDGWECGNCWIDPELEAFAVTDTWWYRHIISRKVHDDINRYCTYRDITSWIINNVTVGGQRRGGYSEAAWERTKKRLYETGLLKPSPESEACFAALYKGSITQFGQTDILGIYDDVCYDIAAVKPTTFNGWEVNWCGDNQLTTYLNIPSVQQAYHVTNPPPWGWASCTPTTPNVLEYNQADTQSSYFSVVRGAVAAAKFPIMFISGDADSIVPVDATRRWVEKLVTSLNLTTVNDFHEWFANTNGRQVAGWSTSYSNNFTFLSVRQAAHIAPFNSPLRCFQMMKNFFEHGTM